MRARRSSTERSATLIRALPAHARRPTAGTCSSSSGSSTGPQGRRGRQRRHPGLDRAAARPRRRATRCSCRPRRPGVGARASSSGAASTPTTASGWSHGQRLMQASERHLPRLAARATGIDGVERDFYVRQLRDWKGSVADRDRWSPTGMARLRRGCAAGRSPGPTPAPATGSRSPPTSAARDAFDQAIADVRRDLRRPERARLRGARRRGRRTAGSTLERGA